MPRLVNSQTGEYVDVPAEQVVPALQSGQFAVEEGASFDVVTDTGEVGQVDPSQLQTVLQTGGRIASDDEARQAREAKQYGTAGQQAIGAAEAVGRGLVPGFSAIETELGADPEAVRAREEQLGDMGTGLEVAAGVGSLLIPGAGVAKLGKAGQLARGATAAPRAIARAGQAVEAGAAAALKGRLGSGALGQAAEVALPKVAGGALEGAVWGAGEALNEEAISGGNYERLGETLTAHVTPAALLGGGAAGAFGLGGAAVRGSAKKLMDGWAKLKPAEIESLASKHFGQDVPRGFGEKVKDLYAKVAGIASGAGEDDVRRLMNKDVRKMALSGDQVRETATRDITDHVRRIVETEPIVIDASAGKLKADLVHKSVKTGDPNTMQQARRMGVSFRDELRGMQTASGKSVFGPGTDKAVRSMVTDAEELLNGMRKRRKAGLSGATGGEADTYLALDNIKRRIGKRLSAAKRAKPIDPDAIELNNAYKEKLTQLYNGIKTHLEDVSVWGQAAEQQAARNAKVSKALDHTRGRFNREMTGTIRGQFDERVRVADQESVGRYVNSLKDWKRDQVHGAVREHLSARRDMLETIAEQADLSAGEAAKVREAIEATKAFEKTLDDTAETIASENLLRDVIDAESNSGIGALMGVGAGTMVGGALGGALGGAAGLVMRPGHTLRQLGLLEQMASGVNERIGGMAKQLVARGQKAVEKVATSQPVRSRKLPPAIAHMIDASDDDRQARVQERVKELEKLAANPDAIRERIEEGLGDVPTIAPNTATAMHISTQKVLANLLENAPSIRDRGPFGWGKPSISVSDAAQFAFYSAGAESPLEAIESQLADGKLNSHTVRAVRENHPHLFEQIRSSLVEELSQLDSPPDYQHLLMLGRHFDITTTASLSPEYVAGLQGEYATEPTEPEAPPPSINTDAARGLGDGEMTEAQRLAMGD